MNPHRLVTTLSLMFVAFCIAGCSKKPERPAELTPNTQTPLTTSSPVQETSTPPADKAVTEANEMADKFWRAVVLQCGSNSYYFATKNINVGRFTFYECKHKSGPVLDSQVYSPRSLSEAERLNGVDPLPVQYEGNSVMTFQTCRQFTPGFGGYDSSAKFHEGWTAWYDTERTQRLALKKAKDKWTSNTVLEVEQLVQMKCSDLTDIQKRMSQ